MNYIQAIVLGIVQSITEWLPVSSSAHLAITDRIFQINASLFYFVILHLATLISLCIYFRKDILKYFIDTKKKTLITTKGWYIIWASIPIFLAGYFFNNVIEIMFTDFSMIGSALIVNAIILFTTKYFDGKNLITINEAIKIGVMQVFALVPGISRSGITISSGFFTGLKKEEVIMFSMMLALPAIAGATAYQLLITPFEFSLPMLVGFIIAIVSGYFALGLLIKRVREGTFSDYWVYCLILGLIMLFN